MSKIYFLKDIKYLTVQTATFQTDFRPVSDIHWRWLHLDTSGLLTIDHGYAWDGPSGPVIDRSTNQRGSLCHDALYQLMRQGLLSHKDWKMADNEFFKILEEDGAWSLTIWVNKKGLAIAGGSAAHPKNARKVYSAP